MSLPHIPIFVLHAGGREHLEACLPSLEALDYPRDRREIVVVDNGSTDGSREWLAARWPGVTVQALGRNLGFTAAYNAAIQGSSSEWVALLNNDTRVDRGWLGAMVATAERQRADCVGAVMLDWKGRAIDFGGGIVSLFGHAWQRHHGRRAGSVLLDESPTPFACAGAMLIRREAFLAAGGFDPAYFAYFEDVDLGWRLALLGRPAVLSPGAIVYHRVHGTAGRQPFAPRLRLYERNALFTIYKNLGDESLARVLPVAVALTAARALRHSSLPSGRFQLGRPSPETVPLAPQTAAALLALEEFGAALPRLRTMRATVQSTRQVDDAAIFRLMGDPLRLHEIDDAYRETARALLETFDLEGLVAGRDRPVHPVSGRRVRAAGLDAPDGQPRLSVIVLTMLGSTHLPPLLDSLAAQSYPADRVELIVVDNASGENPADTIRRHAPGARHLRLASNVGFCAANNAAAREATGDYLVFLNDDTRVEPDFLSRLVRAANRRGATAVGARILSWDGTRIDFAGGGMNFYGRGFQTGVGSTELTAFTAENSMLFGCGAALMVDRGLFLEAGGFNERLFVYYEDSALGWQVWLRGGSVWFAPRATVYHRHHGTTGEWPAAVVLRLYERNALTVTFEQFEEPTLRRTLAPAIVLAVERALILAGLAAVRDETRIPRASWLRRLAWRLKPQAMARQVRADLAGRGASRRLGVVGSLRAVGPGGLVASARELVRFLARDPQERLDRRWRYFLERGAQPSALDAQPVEVSGRAAAVLTGLDEFLRGLPQSVEARAAIENARARSDAEIFGRFSDHWLSPMAVGDAQGEYEALEEALVDAFGLETLRDEWIVQARMVEEVGG